MRGLKRYTVTLLAALLGLALLVGLNLLAARSGWRWDATKDKRHSLANESVQILTQLDKPVMAAAFYRPQEPGRDMVRELFELIAERTDNFTYEFVDPDRSPFKAREYDVAQLGTVVLASDDRRENILFADEEKLINGIVRVSDPEPSTIYFLTGHGELDPTDRSAGPDGKGSPDSCAMFAQSLKKQGITVETLLLARQKSVPDAARALVVLGPQKDFLDYELDLLGQYVEKGGRLIVALEPESGTNLEGFLADKFSIVRRAGFVVDPVGRMVVGDPMVPLVQNYAPHPATRDFDLMTLFPTCGALTYGGVATAGGDLVPLGRSSDRSWLETDVEGLRKGRAHFDAGKDTKGPLWLVAAWERKAGVQPPDPQTGKRFRMPRAVVFADQDFVSDRYVNLSGNLDLARNSVQWVLEREGLITVSKPKGASVFLLLTPGQRAALTWLPLVVAPLAALGMALMVAVRRRRANG